MVGSCTRETADSAFIRKLRKPLIEKKRRDRMNVSIDNLKALLAKSSNNPASVVKMDKAEILEMAVSHLAQLNQRSRNTRPDHVTSYRAGFRECREETVRYLSSSVMMPNPVLVDLDSHLHNVCDISNQDDVIMSSAVKRTSFLHVRRCTSSPVLDLPPTPVYSPFCRSNMFSPIASAEIRGHQVHSPFDSSYVSRCNSPFGMPSPAPSTCSSTTSDSSASGTSQNFIDSASDFESYAHAQPTQHKSELDLDHVIKQEAPWRPW